MRVETSERQCCAKFQEAGGHSGSSQTRLSSYCKAVSPAKAVVLDAWINRLNGSGPSKIATERPPKNSRQPQRLAHPPQASVHARSRPTQFREALFPLGADFAIRFTPQESKLLCRYYLGRCPLSCQRLRRGALRCARLTAVCMRKRAETAPKSGLRLDRTAWRTPIFQCPRVPS